MSAPRLVRARLAAVVLTSASVLAACGGGGDAALSEPTSLPPSTASTTSAAPTTTVEPGAPAPLTGVPTTDEASLARPALIMKIDNIDAGGCDVARPQIGIGRADMVYEILVEGITRFMAVFHSDIPETVGPVRSARSSDVDLVAGFNSPLFGWSGNNANVAADFAKIRGRYVDVGHSSPAGDQYYRDRGRCAPHNLLVHPSDLYDYAEDKKTGVPQPVFTFRASGEALPATARAAGGVHLTMGQDVVYAWNAATSSWDRVQRGSAHTTVDAGAETVISPVNVVVVETAYTSSSTPGSPLAVTVGKGKVHVYTDGKVIDGTWERADNSKPWTLLDEAGAVIALTPGTTWVSLSQAGKIEELDTTAAAKYLSR